MIKVVAPANLHPGRRSLAEFQNYWGESHGPLFSNTKLLRRYVQHLTLPESYGGDPNPTFDGVSMFWYDDLDAMRTPSTDPVSVALRQAVVEDDRQLFDRLPGWPLHHKRASVIAEEKIIIDGPTTPDMVKGIWIAAKMPGLTDDEFYGHWLEVHGPLAAKAPGMRRYVQNHAVRDIAGLRPMTHDGWSEAWFDDLESLHRAVASPEWAALREDGRTLFANNMGVGIAREKVQKWDGWTYKDWGAASMSEDEIRAKLKEQRYGRLAADAKAPGQIKDAAQAGALAVWTWEHIVTLDASHIDERPDGERQRLKL
ncbi:MAG TPA: EthD domain-containing protein [Dehalococcoidia bacterium]|nr:EthD domain-containing protein [Dehalococcoidia bacterium]